MPVPVAEPPTNGHAPTGAAESRIHRHLVKLWEREAGVRAALDEAQRENRQALDDYAGDVDYRLRMIEIEVDLAAATFAAWVAEDPDTFAQAIDAEVDAWKLYVERLQGRAALHTGSARVEAEESIRELRGLVTALEHRLEGFRAGPTGAWRERRAPVRTASSELARALDAISDTFD
jgi:hypothetical protein